MKEELKNYKMTKSGPININDQNQIGIIGNTNLHYNSNDELIFISYEYAGNHKWQQVTDTKYIGGIQRSDIVRTKTFAAWEEDD